jgi:hypothetical protein
MIQLYSLMWILAIFFSIFGAMRGWNREVIGLAGILLGMFALFQLDAWIRGGLLLGFSRGQAFMIQMGIFLVIVFFAYQNRTFVQTRRVRMTSQEGILGAFVGFLNGYIIGGAIWYFIDINEYPFAPYITAPGANSPSAQRLSQMPLVFLSGGVYGSGDLLLIAVILLFLLVLVIL